MATSWLRACHSPEGAVVTVLSWKPNPPFALSVDDEYELISAIAEVEGRFVSLEELLGSLRRYS